jgi:hypothetical protein
MSRTIAGKNIREKLNLSENKPLAVVRFVSHGATHSLGEKGLSLRFKIQSATTLSEYAHVVVSSEEDLPFALKKYALKCSPDELHRLMASADVLFGESTTMAAESAVLGIPSVVIENKGRGYLTDLQQRFGVVQLYTTREKDKALEAAVQVLQKSPSKAERQSIAEQIREGTTDVTALLLWITGNFPESLEELLNNPGILARFDREKGNTEIS